MAGRENIEDNILSGIESATGTPWEQDVDTGDEVNDEGQDQLETQLARREVRDPPRAKETDEGDEDLTDPLKKPEQRKPDNKEQQRGKPRTNERGDLVDEQGKVIANRGMERRLHSQLERTRETVSTLQERNTELARQVADAQFLDGLPRRLNLNNDDVQIGLGFAASLKADPVKFAREAIERAVAKGVALQDIVNDEFIPNVSIAATQRLLDERLGPIADRNKQDQDSVVAQREAEEKTNRFLSDYPDAETHQELVAHQMARLKQEYSSRGVSPDPYLLAERAWQQIEEFAIRNKLDVTQPLGPQIEARQNATGRREQPRREQQRRPMPNGSGRGGDVVERKSRSANPDDSYDSIIREAMAEEGIQQGY